MARWRQFVDYYLVKTVLLLLALAGVAALIWHFLSPKEEIVLHCVVLSDTLDDAGDEELRIRLGRRLSVAPERILIDDGFQPDRDGMLIEALFMENNIDMMIASEADFRLFAEEGAFLPLDEAVNARQWKRWADVCEDMPGYDENAPEGAEGEDMGYGTGEVRAYGIRLDDAPNYQRLSVNKKGYLAGIVLQSEHHRAAVEFLQELFADER